MDTDDLPCAPAAERNKEALRAVLAVMLPARGRVLEVACGTGQHACHMAAAFPGLTWQPADCDPQALAACTAWRAARGSANLAAPLALDAAAPESWPVTAAEAVLAVNLIHIAPWAAAAGLVAGAARCLPAGGPLILYGPFVEDGETASSNRAFDTTLRGRDPAWGVRELRDVEALAGAHGLVLERVAAMPANNRTVLFRKEGGGDADQAP